MGKEAEEERGGSQGEGEVCRVAPAGRGGGGDGGARWGMVDNNEDI